MWGAFQPGHQCPERSIRVVLLAKYEEGDVEEEEVETEQSHMELSTFSAGRLSQPKALKLRGKVVEREVLILVDSGASHSFISRKLVEDLQLK